MDLPMIDERGNPTKVAGTRLQAKHIAAFSAYLALLKVEDVSLATGYTEGTIRRWMREPWWKELEDTYVEASFRESTLQVTQMVKEKVMPFLEKALDGEDLDKDETRALLAKSNVAKLIMSLGAKPLLHQHRGGASGNAGVIINNTNNTQVNNTSNSVDVDKVKALTPEQKHRLALGEAIPVDITLGEDGQ